MDIEDIKLCNNKGKIKFLTYGCSHNVLDSEYMMQKIIDDGYEIDTNEFSDVDGCNVVVMNSCTVKNPSEQAVKNILEKSKKLNIPMVITGCVPQADKSYKCNCNTSLVGVDQLDHIIDAINDAKNGNGKEYINRGPLFEIEDKEHHRINKHVEIIVACTGCEMSCAYCKTKHARANLRSYPINKLISKIKLLKQNHPEVTEIRLTGEDIGAYGKDIGIKLPDLLYAICDEIENTNIMLKIGMINPPYVKEYFNDLVKIFKKDCVYQYIHIPIQSGSTRVLDAMKRKYTREDFDDVVSKLKENIPEMTVATDIICGFPTETDDEFKETLECVEKFKFPVINISQMYIRPGTVAAKMKAVDSKVKKERSRTLTTLFESYKPYDMFLNSTRKVWINEIATDGKSYAAHTQQYVQVLIPINEETKDLLGKTAMVKIVDFGKWYVRGEIIEIL